MRGDLRTTGYGPSTPKLEQCGAPWGPGMPSGLFSVRDDASGTAALFTEWRLREK
jgi:hypothetical protein